MAEYRLHCISQSGNAYKAALMLALGGADWEPVFVDFFNGEGRKPEWREAVSEMGEVPVLEHNGRRLSQSGAILTYLARRLGRFEWRGAECPDGPLAGPGWAKSRFESADGGGETDLAR